jgi:hypothetical protein
MKQMTPDEMLALSLLSQIRIATMPEDMKKDTAAALTLLQDLLEPPPDPDATTWRQKLGAAILMRVCAMLTMDPVLNRLSADFARTSMIHHGVPHELPTDLSVTPLMWLSGFIQDADKYDVPPTPAGTVVH